MRKEYPYLQDSYYEDANSQRQRRNFLATIDNFINQKQYVKVTLLNWQEDPIKEIEGELVSGTISKDGSSSVRRTCQFTTVVNRGEYTVEDGEMDFAINNAVNVLGVSSPIFTEDGIFPLDTFIKSRLKALFHRTVCILRIPVFLLYSMICGFNFS